MFVSGQQRHILALAVLLLVGAVALMNMGRILAETPAGGEPAASSSEETSLSREQPAYRTGVKVYWLSIREEITPRLTLFAKRTIEKAKESGAEYIILDINTPGGRVDATVEICNELTGLEKIRTIAFLNKEATSGGAFIAFACREIVMVSPSTIGSAMGIYAVPGEIPKPVEEKGQSYLRSKIRSFAAQQEHNPDLAEAMVDISVSLKWVAVKNRNGELVEHRIVRSENLQRERTEAREKDLTIEEIKDIVTDTKLLNLTDDEALKYGLAAAVVNNREGLFEYLRLKDPQIVEYEPTISEAVYNLITSPFVTTILLLLAVGGLYMEFTTPGFGVPGIVGCGALLLLLTIGFVLDTANVWTVLVVFAGIILLAVELFVIPGFGVVGVLGIVFVVAGIVLSLVPFYIPETPWEMDYFLATLRNVGIGMVCSVALVVILLKSMPHVPGLSRLALKTEETAEKGFISSSAELRSLMGAKGAAITTLRPAGKAEFGDRQFQVVAEGEFIESGEKVEVIDVTENRIVVRKA